MRRLKKKRPHRILRTLLGQSGLQNQTARRTLRLESLELRQMLSAVPWMPNHGGPDHTAADGGSGPEAAAYVARELQQGGGGFEIFATGDNLRGSVTVNFVNVKAAGSSGPDNIDTPDPTKNFNSSKSNTSTRMEGGGGDGPDPQMTKNFNSSKSNTSAVDGGGDEGEPQGRDRCGAENHEIRDPGLNEGPLEQEVTLRPEKVVLTSTSGGGGGGPDEDQGTDYNLRGSFTVNVVNVQDPYSTIFSFEFQELTLLSIQQWGTTADVDHPGTKPIEAAIQSDRSGNDTVNWNINGWHIENFSVDQVMSQLGGQEGEDLVDTIGSPTDGLIAIIALNGETQEKDHVSPQDIDGEATDEDHKDFTMMLGDIKGEATDDDVSPQDIDGEATDKDHKDFTMMLGDIKGEATDDDVSPQDIDGKAQGIKGNATDKDHKDWLWRPYSP